ncbi:16S rRNA (guanine(966)-N(2))-methyltransferase RsmD [candidate division WWE3 bacterium]|jgi:16S rRNA (guanine(966)-N(2))-methyltransferase RsmD|uniref:16S rRNA (Guanine(966)-N(2))-methyltransferase RsmD n=1 Tax=candidate division WWE3 bacterium TaxID=2053526 RepID=A0A3A4ZDU0_UNCKA|nr:MAG: 16S rRNA (guanine(966)-N(2))-methyltransferase RsmD [candidate division WWE3 bacterium]
MIRVTTGIAKNKKLEAPDVENFRAVQEKVKLAVFAILSEKINNAICLDLYAGSGNLGIEALSRGASWCDFVDEHPESIEIISKNIKFTGFEEKSGIFRRDAVKYVTHAEKLYNIIFCDPFYENTSHVHLLNNMVNILADKGVLIFFHGEQLDINATSKKSDLKILTQRKFGRGYFTILQKDH